MKPSFKDSNVLDRRSFLALATAGLLNLNTYGKSVNNTRTKDLGNLALQLYTVRREIEKDLYGTLEKVAKIGYNTVETAFWPDHISIEEAAKALKALDFKVCSIHCELPIGEEKSNMLKLAEAYQCDKMIWHGWPEDPRYGTLDGIKQLSDVYNEANHFAQKNGLQFGLHNHWWEFRNQVEGKYPYHWLIPMLDQGIFFELDTYWIKVAGMDPAMIVGQFADKAPLLHIKDGPARYTESLGEDEPEPMVAVGQGIQEFPAIVKAADGSTKWMIVEMDKTATDVFKALEESYRYLIDNNLVMR